MDENTVLTDLPHKERLANIFDVRIRFHPLKSAGRRINLPNALAPLTVPLVGGYMVIQGTTTISVVVAVVSGVERLADPLRQLVAFQPVAARARVKHRMIG